jgi:TatD DNase family protein
MLETDAPWCEIKNSHAGISHVKTVFPVAKKAAKWEATMGVKGRNEPGNIVQVMAVGLGRCGMDSN